MSKFIDALIFEVRESTENEEFDDSVGLSEEEILKFINDAQYRLHAKIIAQHPDVFIVSEELDVVANQEVYPINFKAAFKNKVSKVQYSYNGDPKYYDPLDITVTKNSTSRYEGYPTHYSRKSGNIYLVPVPSSSNGKIKVDYVSKIKRVDKRRGLILSVEGTGNAPTSIDIDYINGSTVDNTELKKRTRITVVDKYGTIKMDNILVSSIDSSAGVNDATVTIDTSKWSSQTGEIVEAGDYIVSGRYTTTHSELEEEVERYIQAYAQWKVLKRDSSVDSQEAIQELSQIESDIVASYADISDDVFDIPETNDNWED